MGIPFLYSWLWMVGIIGVALFLSQNIQDKRSVKQVMLSAWLAMSCKYALVLMWGWSAYPLTWIHLPSPWVEILFLSLYFVGASAVLAVPFSLYALIVRMLWKRNIWYVTILPFVWVLTEIVGSMLYSLVLLGPGIMPNIYFSFGYVGYLLAVPNGFLFFAKFGGVYALSVLLVGIAVGLLLLIQSSIHSLYKVGILLVIIIFASGMFTNIPPFVPTETTNMIIIDTQFPASLFQQAGGYSKKETEIQNAVRAAITEQPEVILLPEDSRFTDIFSDIDTALEALQHTKQKDFILVDSSRTLDERGKTVMRGYIYDTKNNTVYVIDKRYLTPQGEFMPYIVRGFLRAVSDSPWKQKILRYLRYQTGVQNTLPSAPENIPNVLFCMESISPLSVRQLMQTHHSSFIAHPVSHTWFSDSAILRQQLYHMLRVQAVWNNVPIVASGNMFDGYTMYPDGTYDTGTIVNIEKYWSLRSII